MIAGTETRSETSAHSGMWLAAAIGTGVGIAALAYSRRRRSPWDRAKDRASKLIDSAKEEAKPWMGVAAGTAAAGGALAVYLRSRKESGWQRASRRASEIASRVGPEARPWASLAASAALALASTAYARKARRRTIRGIDESTAERINNLTERGLRLLRRLRSISDQTGSLYPRVRRALA